jgi:hypothetical protein
MKKKSSESPLIQELTRFYVIYLQTKNQDLDFSKVKFENKPFKEQFGEIWLTWSITRFLKDNESVIRKLIPKDGFSFETLLSFALQILSKISTDYFSTIFQSGYIKRKFQMKDERDDFLKKEGQLINNFLKGEKDDTFINRIILSTVRNLFDNITKEDINEFENTIKNSSTALKLLNNKNLNYKELESKSGIIISEIKPALANVEANKLILLHAVDSFNSANMFEQYRKELLTTKNKDGILNNKEINRIVMEIHEGYSDLLEESGDFHLPLVKAVHKYKLFLHQELRKPFTTRKSSGKIIFQGIDTLDLINYLTETCKCFSDQEKITLVNLFDDPVLQTKNKIRFLKSAAALATVFRDLFEHNKVGPDKKSIANWLSKNFLIKGRDRTEPYFYRLLRPITKSEAMAKVPKNILLCKDAINISRFL